MKTSRTYEGAALAAGALLIAQGVAAALTRQTETYAPTTGDVLSDGLLAAGLLVALAALDGLRRLTAPRWGVLAMAGQAAIVVAIAASMAAERDILDWLYIAGTVGWIAGQIGMVVAVVRGGRPELRPALALPLASLTALALSDSGGAILLGLTWMVLARTSRPRERTGALAVET
jgi:hypothetical protein